MRNTVGIFAFAVLISGVSLSDAWAGSDVYASNCVACHGTGGKGDGPAGMVVQPKPADFSVALKDKSDEEIAKVIKGGGMAVGKSPIMPAFGSRLSEAEINGLVAHLKDLASK